ncbi:methylamine utilization protein [Idiomarina sp. HP20-50]|uniref:methylamine utilization protein n=1 Tax=Idiomarina sp. HP20-50 TaxID=3070813 RepID=UPI00294ADF93|nr:methylamine utilization protein [Idiomarina sp. HP20-50]MDV6315469.1 methylamine utilization protein [Idiomarina sp. HP20-50]
MKLWSIAVLLLVLGIQNATAETVTVKILAANGEPLANAAVLIDSPKTSLKGEKEAIVDQVDKQFTPTVSAIEPGTDVVFPNSDNIRHHVYSFSDAKSFELKLYSDKERPSVNFDKEGIVTMGCNIHDQMIAYVVVSDKYDVTVTNEQGVAELTIPEGETLKDVTVWHYWMGDKLSQAQKITLARTSGRLTGQVQVSPPQKEKKELSRLEQRFNRKGNQ